MIRDLGLAVQARRAVRFLRAAGRFTFTRRTDWLEGKVWAHSLEDELFHYRGTLTDTINLTAILNPGATIKLLGVDLDARAYFFSDEFERDPAKWGIFKRAEIEGTGRHETAGVLNGTPGTQKKIPFLLEQVRARGGDIVCCSPKSLLVTRNLLQYVAPG